MPYPAAPTLLYVEDEILIQITFLAFLEDAGFRIIVASDGAQALALLATQPLDLQGLITDVNLGDGPNGWDVARSARALVCDLPVVYVTSASHRDWTSNGVCNSLMISKPCLPSQPVAAMTSLFKGCPVIPFRS